MTPRYRVTLTLQERNQLKASSKSGRTNSKRYPCPGLASVRPGAAWAGWTVARVAEAMGVTARTLERLNERFVEDGLRASLQRKQRDRPARAVLFDGAFKARLVALACAEAVGGAAALDRGLAGGQGG